MKQYRLRLWVKVVMVVSAIVLAFIILSLILDNMSKDSEIVFNNCMDQGYSYNYCMKNVYGIY